LAWTIKGIGKTYRAAVEGAATRAGMSAGQWLDGVILDHPAGPTRSEADAEITRALEALESRIEERGARLDEIIRPLTDDIARLEEESQAIRGGGDAESRAAREIERHIARMDALHPAGEGGGTADNGPDPDDAHPRLAPGEASSIPDLGNLRRHKLLRLAAGVGAMVMIAGSAGLGAWLWNAHENLPQASKSTPSGVLPHLAGQPRAKGPLPPTEAVKSPAEINDLRKRAQDPTQTSNPDAAYELGMALLKGKRGIASLREAGEWIADAALAGHARAQLQLGRLYAGGEGYARDLQQAFFWISAAAEQGIPEAAYELGLLYSRGEGIERSHALAAKWFRNAGEKNHAGALYQLGLIFELGLDYRANPRRALKWYRQAATAGSAAAVEKVQALEARGIVAPVQPSPPPPVPAAAAPAPETPAPVTPAPVTPAPVAATPLNRQEIAELQRLLGTLALDPGPADGVPGAKTIEAVKLYQQMGGLKVDGKLSRNLLEQVREVAGQGGTR